MSRRLISRMILLSYLALITYAITRSIQTGSTTGLILSVLSLVAGIHFLSLLQRLKKQVEAERDL